MQLVSTENPINVIPLLYNPNEGSFFQKFGGWAPDSKSLLFEGSDVGAPEVGSPILTIYHINDDEKISRTTIKNSLSLPIYWSLDASKMVMVESSNRRLVILDRISLEKSIAPIDNIISETANIYYLYFPLTERR